MTAALLKKVYRKRADARRSRLIRITGFVLIGMER